MIRWLTVLCLLVFTLPAGAASACSREQVVTPYWSAPPADLAADEIAVDVDYLGYVSGRMSGAGTPSTMGTSLLKFRVKRPVAGATPLPENLTLVVLFKAGCRTLLVQTRPDLSTLLIGKFVAYAGQPLTFEPRYRDCARDYRNEASGQANWICPFAPSKPGP